MKLINIVRILIISFCCTGVTFPALGKTTVDYSSAKKCAREIAIYEKKYSIPKNMLYAMSLAETRKYVARYKGGVAWPWTFQSVGKSTYMLNYRDALKFLRSNLRKGKTNIDVGCMQINWHHHSKAFKKKPELILNPANNVKWAAQSLRNNFKKTKSWQKAIALHHSKNPKIGNSYVKRVNRMMRDIKSRKQKIHAYNV